MIGFQANMTSFLVMLIVVVVSALLTGVIRRYAIHQSVLDVPNERSSHTVPTPRGGGVAIVLSFLGAIVLGWASGVVGGNQVLAVAVGGGLIAIVGFMDDHGHIPARWRLLGHFTGAGVMVWLLGGLPPVLVFGQSLDLGLAGAFLGAVYLVWMLNLYNFMDGIDGLASCEAITACLTCATVYLIGGHTLEGWIVLALGSAVAGFLIWNFPPAKIFMGDAGSGFIGVTVGYLALEGSSLNPSFLWMWLIALGVFVVDATYTLLKRLIGGAKVYEAHRSHAYQHASRRYRSHRKVTCAVCAINLLWLLPLAMGVGLLGWDGATVTIIAYIPLVVIALKFRAGQADL